MINDIFTNTREVFSTSNSGLSQTRVHRLGKHLSSALLEDEILFVRKHNGHSLLFERQATFNTRIDSLKERGLQEMDTECFITQVIPIIMEKRTIIQSENREELTRLLLIASQTYTIMFKNWNKTKPIDDWINGRPIPANLLKLYDLRTQIEEHVDKISSSRYECLKTTLYGMKIEYYGELTLVIYENKVWPITYNHILCVKDVILSHFNLTLYSFLWSTKKYQGIDLEFETNQLLRAGLIDMTLYGENVYKILKSLGSVVISQVLTDNENNNELRLTMQPLFDEFPASRLLGICRLQTIGVTQVCLRLELTGLSKAFGFPTIKSLKSVESWKTKALFRSPRRQEFPKIIALQFKYIFCREYFLDKKRWPKVQLGKGVLKDVRMAYEQNKWTKAGSRQWNYTDFENVKLLKNFDFDYFIDPSELLSDKSLIPSSLHWVNEFDSRAYRILYNSLLKKPEYREKRVILDYLSKESVDVCEIILRMSRRSAPMTWYTIVLMPKEREFKKEAARYFGKLSPEVRLYQVSTEHNLSNTILRYLPGQTMTMGELELSKMIQATVSAPLKYLEDHHIFISCDFSGWCTSHDIQLTEHLFGQFDDLFGIDNVYKHTHVVPLLSHYLFQNRYDPPRQDPYTNLPSPGHNCVVGCDVWVEGLRQKGWTIGTMIIILLAAELSNVRASLMGQGDNQLICLRISKEQYDRQGLSVEQIKSNFLTIFKQLCKDAAIDLKLEETWSSRHLFEFSKRYYYEGVQVSSGLKKVLRLSSDPDSTANIFMTEISSTFANGAMVSNEDCDPGPAYITTILNAAHQLRSWNPALRSVTYEHTASAFMVNRTLGGLPIMLYSQFVIRAVQDPLTDCMSLIRTAWDEIRYRKPLSHWINLAHHTHPTIESMIKDPLGLPLRTPSRPEEMLRESIKIGLSTIVRNIELSNLFSTDVAENKELFIHDLAKIENENGQIHLKLLNYIYGLSTYGLQERIIARFQNTQSIQKIAVTQWIDVFSLYDSIIVLESAIKAEYGRPHDLRLLKDLFDGVCSWTCAQALREKLWGYPITGVTMPAIQEQCLVLPYDDVTETWQPRTILITLDKTFSALQCNIRGKRTPYVGSKTKVKATKSVLTSVVTSSIQTSINKLIELLTWVSVDQEVTDFIKKIISEKTSINLESLQVLARTVSSGSITHRLPALPFRRGGASNFNLTPGTHAVIITDTATEYSKGAQDYTLCFQTLMLYGLSVVRQLSVRETSFYRWGVVVRCNSCTREILPESFMMSKSNYEPLNLTTRIKAIDVHEEDQPASSLNPSIHDYSVCMGAALGVWLYEFITSDNLIRPRNYDGELSRTPEFINLSDFKHVDILTMANTATEYLSSLVTGAVTIAFTNLVFKTGFSEGPLSTVGLSLARVGKQHELCKLAMNNSDCGLAGNDEPGKLLFYVLQSSFNTLEVRKTMPVVLRSDVNAWITRRIIYARLVKNRIHTTSAERKVKTIDELIKLFHIVSFIKFTQNLSTQIMFLRSLTDTIIDQHVNLSVFSIEKTDVPTRDTRFNTLESKELQESFYLSHLALSIVLYHSSDLAADIFSKTTIDRIITTNDDNGEVYCYFSHLLKLKGASILKDMSIGNESQLLKGLPKTWDDPCNITVDLGLQYLLNLNGTFIPSHNDLVVSLNSPLPLFARKAGYTLTVRSTIVNNSLSIIKYNDVGRHGIKSLVLESNFHLFDSCVVHPCYYFDDPLAWWVRAIFTRGYNCMGPLRKLSLILGQAGKPIVEIRDVLNTNIYRFLKAVRELLARYHSDARSSNELSANTSYFPTMSHIYISLNYNVLVQSVMNNMKYKPFQLYRVNNTGEIDIYTRNEKYLLYNTELKIQISEKQIEDKLKTEAFIRSLKPVLLRLD